MVMENDESKILKIILLVPVKLRTTNPLQQIIIKISKDVLFNEFELLNFAIYLDKLTWVNEDMKLENYLFAIAILVKVKINLFTKMIFY